jgi:hypothetical protein
LRLHDMEAILRLELWLLVMGACSSYESDQREWFCLRLAQVVQSLKIRKWYEVQKVLIDFAWVPNVCNPAALTLCCWGDYAHKSNQTV